MAITFDTSNKVIILDSFNVSVSEIWSRWIDWVALSDNSKYLPALSQLGGVAPVALYIYLENGWKVRPQEASGLTTVTGNLLVQGGGNPFVPVLGSFSSQVFLESPLAAQAIEVNSGSGLDVGQDEKLTAINAWIDLMYKAMDLDAEKPNIYADDASRITNPDFTLNKTDLGNGTFKVQRS